MMPPRGGLPVGVCWIWRRTDKDPLGVPAEGILARAREGASNRTLCLLLDETTSFLRARSCESNRGASASHHYMRSPPVRKELLRLRQFCVYASV